MRELCVVWLQYHQICRICTIPEPKSSVINERDPRNEARLRAAFFTLTAALCIFAQPPFFCSANYA